MWFHLLALPEEKSVRIHQDNMNMQEASSPLMSRVARASPEGLDCSPQPQCSMLDSIHLYVYKHMWVGVHSIAQVWR